jgi:hypothetical protein
VRRATAVAALALLTQCAAPAQAAPATYQVDVVDHVGHPLDEVALAVARYDDPVVRLMSRRHVPSGGTASFDLGTCPGVRSFAASAFSGTREVVHTPDIPASPACHTQIELTRHGVAR